MTRGKKIAAWAGVAVTVMVAGAVVIYSWVAEARLDAKFAEYAKAGVAMAPSELAPSEVPDIENASVLYDKAAAEYLNLPIDTRRAVTRLMRLREGEWKEADSADARAVVAAGGEVMRLLREGAFLKRSRTGLGYGSLRVYSAPPWMNARSDLFDLLSVSVESLVRSENATGAVECCRLWHRLKASMEMEPSAVGIVRLRSSSGQFKGLELALNVGEVDEPTLRAMVDALADAESRECVVLWARCIRMDALVEVRNAIRSTPWYGKGGSYQVPGGKWRTVWVTRPAARLDAVCALNMIDRYIALVAEPPWKTRPERQTLRREWEELAKAPQWHPLSSSTGVYIETSLRALDVSIARRCCAKTAVLLRLYRMKHGAYPETLAALSPEFVDKLPKDPFTGKDLVYRRDGAGFVLYSVGTNGIDEGGREDRHDAHGGDIVIRVTR